MGLLKHAILPLFAALHVFSVYACMDLGRWADMIGYPVEGEADRQSIRQLHMLGALRGFNVAFAILCIVGVVSESAHFRGLVVMAEGCLFGVVAWDAYQLGIEGWFVPATQAAVAVVGMAIHATESGIFKDKTKDNKTK